MKKLLIIFLLCILQSCSKPKTVLICGDHICVNKAEAQQFFEENLSIEVKIIDKEKKDQLDLIELNLKENSNNNKKITMKRKENTNKIVKILSVDEKKEILKEVKVKKKEKKLATQNTGEEKTGNLVVSIGKENKTDTKKKNLRKKLLRDEEFIDVCTILEKCNIDEISKYLINEGMKKKFPNITIRQ